MVTGHSTKQIDGLFFKLCARPFCTNGFQINFILQCKVVFIYLSFRLFMDGIEEYLIQPTAWYYVKYRGGTNLFLGLTMAAYSVGTLVLAPFVGFVEEKFDASKAIVVFSTFVILSSTPVNEYFPLFGRFLSGIGEGAVGVLFGAVAKCTTKENRAKAFLYFEGLFCIGSVCGPAIGSVLTLKTDILGFEINAGNSPGVLLTIFWFLLLIVTIFLPDNIAESSKEIIPSANDESDDETTLSKGGRTIYHPTLSSIIFLYYLLFSLVFLFTIMNFYCPLLLKHFWDWVLLM